MKNVPFRENKISWFTQSLIYALLVLAALSAVFNIYNGVAKNPSAFWLSLVGLIFFFSAKVYVISKGSYVSFGSKNMPHMLGNIYRLGYWLMAVGVIFTFSG